MESVFVLLVTTTFIAIVIGCSTNLYMLWKIYKQTWRELIEIFLVGMAISDIILLIPVLPIVIDTYFGESIWCPVFLLVIIRFIANVCYFTTRLFFSSFAGLYLVDTNWPHCLKNKHIYALFASNIIFPLLCEIDFLFVYSDLLFTAEMSDFLEWDNRIHPAFFESLRLFSYSLLNLLFTVIFGLSFIWILSYYMKNKHERSALTGKEKRIYTVCVVLSIYSFLQIGPETAEKIMPSTAIWEAMYLVYVIRLFTYVLSPLMYFQIVNTGDFLGQRAESLQQIPI